MLKLSNSKGKEEETKSHNYVDACKALKKVASGGLSSLYPCCFHLWLLPPTPSFHEWPFFMPLWLNLKRRTDSIWSCIWEKIK